MIRTRYTSEQNLDQFIQELEGKGYEIVETTTNAGITQVRFKTIEVATTVFEQSLKQLRNGNISDGE